MGLAFSGELGLMIMQTLHDASFARLYPFAQALSVLHAGMAALRLGDLLAAFAGKLVLVLLQATGHATLAGLHAWAQLFRIGLARRRQFLALLFGFGNAFAASRRQIRLVLLQARRDATAAGLDIFAEFLQVGVAGARILALRGERPRKTDQGCRQKKVATGRQLH
jgi:hypothetical protein